MLLQNGQVPELKVRLTAKSADERQVHHLRHQLRHLWCFCADGVGLFHGMDVRVGFVGVEGPTHLVVPLVKKQLAIIHESGISA